ncbi:uncharacterized protein LOC113205850 isoform X2 [Frankliniella occidentalis]|uniref:Uncharacterized protein LOC113205850 isoform X2 n=1 Tax=Frankliniella occidentalis TaxID=133901 RepID=A0A9C6UCP9_FRAOC|nr:uncharacterized protein LOC113205850 isoform X2 [Frankliniella occidentalis]
MPSGWPAPRVGAMSGPEDCDCPGPPLPPPPLFDLPPPPRPPFLQAEPCSDQPLKDIETCDALPVSNRRGDAAIGTVVDAEYHSSPVLPSVAVIALCSVLLLAMVCLATALVWKHKRKMQSFLPCKTSPAPRCEANGNTVIYEDLTNMRPRLGLGSLGPALGPRPNTRPLPLPRQGAPMEMLSVDGSYPLGRLPVGLPGQPVFLMGNGRHQGLGPEHAVGQEVDLDLYNPVYEELSGSRAGSEDEDLDESDCGGGRGPGRGRRRSLSRPASEDEFAEDELSVGEADRAGAPDTRLGGSHGAAAATPNGGGDLARDVDSSDADDRRGFLTQRVPRSHSSTSDPRRGRSLDRRRGRRHLQQQQQQLQALQQQLKQQQQVQAGRTTAVAADGSDFHEGLLLDALLQMYPTQGAAAAHAGTHGARQQGRPPARGPGRGSRGPQRGQQQQQPPVPAVAHRLPYLLPPPAQLAHQSNQQAHLYESPGLVNPYESVPVLGQLQQLQQMQQMQQHLSTFRPSASHDSDSGYSNNTSGGRGSGSGHSSGRSRADPHSRLSALSDDMVLS